MNQRCIFKHSRVCRKKSDPLMDTNVDCNLWCHYVIWYLTLHHSIISSISNLWVPELCYALMSLRKKYSLCSYSGWARKHWQYNMVNKTEFLVGHGNVEEDTLRQPFSYLLKWLFHRDSFTCVHISDWKYLCMYAAVIFLGYQTLFKITFPICLNRESP